MNDNASSLGGLPPGVVLSAGRVRAGAHVPHQPLYVLRSVLRNPLNNEQRRKRICVDNSRNSRETAMNRHAIGARL